MDECDGRPVDSAGGGGGGGAPRSASEVEEKPRGEGLKKRYSRSQLEAMRLAGGVEQRKRWEEVYRHLEPGVAREYDGLLAAEAQKKKKNKKLKSGGERKNEEEVFPIDGKDLDRTSSKCFEMQNLYEAVCAEDGNVLQNYSILEEQHDNAESMCYEDDNSSDEYDGIRKTAFLVEGEPDFDSGPPLDGMEYLRRVRWEAAQIPKVKVAKFNSSDLSCKQTPYMLKIPEMPQCPPNLLPTKQWEDHFLADFSKLRQAFEDFESSCDQPSIIGGNSTNHSKQCNNCVELPKSVPTLTTIRGMDTVSRAATLRNYIDMLESASTVSRTDCLWLFALCVAVDTPLQSETCASLRSLLRKCLGILSTKSGADDDDDDEIAMLNILVAISGKYFGQNEK